MAQGIALASAIPLRGSQSGALRRLRRAPRSPSLPRSGRAASTGAASLVVVWVGLNRLPQGRRCPPFLRQRTAPPQTVRAPDTRRHRCHHPSGWGGGGCRGDRRVKAPIVLIDELRWRRARPRSGGPRAHQRRSLAGPWRLVARRLSSASAWSRHAESRTASGFALNLGQLGCHERWRRVAGVGNVCGGAVG